MLDDQDRFRYISRARELAFRYFDGTPPCNLEALYGLLGILDVRECQLEHDARIVPVGRHGFAIEVNALVSGARRRLSIAHELAHLIMWDLDGDLRSGPAVERLCNDLAGELLVPENMLRRVLLQQGTLGNWRDYVTCSSIFTVSRQFAVSIEVAARRVFRDFDLAPNRVAIIWRQFADSETAALRIGSAWHSPKWEAFIPRRKRAPKSSIIYRAFDMDGTFSARESLQLGSLKGTFDVYSSGYMSFPLRAALPPERSVLSLISKIEPSAELVPALQMGLSPS